MSDLGLSVLKCPSCGASLAVEDDDTSITCPYCNSQVIIPDELRPQKDELPPIFAPPSEAPSPQPPPIPIQVDLTKHRKLFQSIGLVWVVMLVLFCLGGILMFWASSPQGWFSRAYSGETSDVESAPVLLEDTFPIPTFTPLAELLLKFGAEGDADGQLDDARYIAVDPAGNIFAADYTGGRVQKFDPQGGFLMRINVPTGEGNNEVYIRGMGIDSLGRLYVARDGEILIYDTQSGDQIGTIPSGWPEIYYDTISVAGDYIYATNGMAGTDDLLKLTLQGEILFHQQEVIESIEKDDPALGIQLTVDPQGQIYVLSSFGPHIYVYNDQGAYLYHFGEDGSGLGQISLSTNIIAVDPRGRLYVASGFRIDEFDSQGNYLNYSLDTYDDSDQGVPMGMTFDSAGYLYLVCNNGRILKYQINSN